MPIKERIFQLLCKWSDQYNDLWLAVLSGLWGHKPGNPYASNWRKWHPSNWRKRPLVPLFQLNWRKPPWQWHPLDWPKHPLVSLLQPKTSWHEHPLVPLPAKAKKLVPLPQAQTHYLLIAATLSLLIACQPNTTQTEDTATLPATSWQPTKVSYAKGFQLTYHDQYKMLHLVSGQDTLHYLLLPKESTPPEGISYDQIIRIPVSRIVTQSTTHLGLIAFAGVENVVAAVDETDFIYSQKIRQQVREGSIVEVGGGESLNMEQVIALSPDLLMVSGMPNVGLERYQTLLRAGIPVLINTEWMENMPLGEAEWVKLVAALTNKEAVVQQKFDQVVQQYDSMASLTAKLTGQASVITGSPFQGSWFVSGDNGYFSQLLQKAGASWSWSGESQATTLPLDFEVMYTHGLQANYWLNPGQINSKQELLAKDKRFADFKAFRQSKVYNNNRRMNPEGGGNDYYESGAASPHIILADLIKILHPELLPGHTLYYYQKIE